MKPNLTFYLSIVEIAFLLAAIITWGAYDTLKIPFGILGWAYIIGHVRQYLLRKHLDSEIELRNEVLRRSGITVPKVTGHCVIHMCNTQKQNDGKSSEMKA